MRVQTAEASIYKDEGQLEQYQAYINATNVKTAGLGLEAATTYQGQSKQEATTSMSGGKKFDGDKTRLDLLDAGANKLTADAFAFGAKKYGDFNYRSGIGYRRLQGAALRHITSFMENEDNDPESGLCHLGHALATLHMLTWMYNNRKDLDDRYKGPNATNAN